MRICFFEKDSKGIYYWRIINPLEELARRGHEIISLPDVLDNTNPDYEKNVEIVINTLDDSDILFLSFSLDPAILKFVREYKSLDQYREVETNGRLKQLKIIADYDDSIFNISPTNSRYIYYGTNEVKFRIPGVDGDKTVDQWIDGKTYVYTGDTGVPYNVTFDIKNNLKKKTALEETLPFFDAITTTTEALAREYRGKTNKVIIAPNAIDFSMYNIDYKLLNDTGKIRIGWALSSSHFIDWAEIRPHLGEVLKNNPNVQFVFIGTKFGTGRDIPLSQVDFIEWGNGMPEYLTNMLLSKLDIGICPLKDDKFNSFKSPLKWEEYAALKIPVVCSNVVYGEHLENGVDALIYKDMDEFKEKLQSLIDNMSLRYELSEKAYSSVKEKYDIKNIGDIYEKEFKNLVSEIELVKI